MKAVILAAGAGTRLEPLTLAISKSMIPLAGRPMLDWVVDSAKAVADKVVIVVRREQTDILEHFNGRPDIEFVYQDKPLGTGHALMQAKGKVSDDFLLLNGDILTTREDIRALAKLPAPAIAGFEVPNPKQFGVLTIGSNGKVTELVEKPANPKSKIINAGIYKLNASIFPLLEHLEKSPRGEYEVTDALAKLMPMNCHKLAVWEHMTYPSDIPRLSKFVLENLK